MNWPIFTAHTYSEQEISLQSHSQVSILGPEALLHYKMKFLNNNDYIYFLYKMAYALCKVYLYLLNKQNGFVLFNWMYVTCLDVTDLVFFM